MTNRAEICLNETIFKNGIRDMKNIPGNVTVPTFKQGVRDPRGA